MASAKRIGFFWGEEKITIVELDRNVPGRVISTSLASKANNPTAFNSNLTEEIQIVALLQKMLKDNKVVGNSFFVSLPVKDIILRSFVIPYVKPEDIQNAIKFEAKKYMPFDMKDLSFVFHSTPFAEEESKRLQIIFFAVRREVLERYKHILGQVNVAIRYCEPYMVSLSKALLFKKEIKITDHLAVFVLDRNLGRICFIDQGIPQFIREFSLALPVPSEEIDENEGTLNSRIINEVGNSFDFYGRQFSGERIDSLLLMTENAGPELLSALEAEIKVKVRKFLPVAVGVKVDQGNDIDAFVAMGAVVAPPLKSLFELNFLKGEASSIPEDGDWLSILESYKEIIFILLICVVALVVTFILSQEQLKVSQQQYKILVISEGASLNVDVADIQAEIDKNQDLLTKYKAIRLKSEVTHILLRVASHMPVGAKLTELSMMYDPAHPDQGNVFIDIKGNVYREDPNEQIVIANQIYSDLKNDTELQKFVNKVNLISLTPSTSNGKQVTSFYIGCS